MDLINRIQEIESFNFTEALPTYAICKEAIENTTRLTNEIELLKENPEIYIHDYFSELKRNIDLRRENLQMDINNYSDRLIEKIDTACSDCLSAAKNSIAQSRMNIEESKLECKKLQNLFDSLDIRQKKQNDFLNEINGIKQSLNERLEDIKNLLIQNREYKFEFDEIYIQGEFGSLLENRLNKNFRHSSILDTQLEADLINLCDFPEEQKWELIYKASVDGFGSEEFHSKCDGFSKTLTVIKSSNENIFGGYTEKAWSSNNQWLKDTEAFIFSLINKRETSCKFKSLYGADAIGCHSEFGPRFGYDIEIVADSDMNKNSFSDLGDCYEHMDYSYGTDQARSLFAGSFHFDTIELEVFYRK